MLNVVMLNVAMLNVVMLNVIMLYVIILNVVMLNVIMLNVVVLSIVTPGAYTTKLFMAVIVAVSQKARVFATASHFHPSLMFAVKFGPCHSGILYETPH